VPELPEVEIFKRYLDATSLHQRIDDVDVKNTYVLKETSARELARGLKGRRFESSRRHGKHLFVRSDGELWLRLHFGMTGSLQYFKNDERVSRHARVVFVFANNHRLAFDDQRQFGEIELLNDIDEFLKEHALGPDALKVDLREFRKILGKRRGTVKSVLLNQRIIAGIGNLYADEILFRVRMHPATEVSQLSDKTLTKLFRAIHYVLRQAIAAKANTNQMPQSWLLPHRGKGGKCPRCGRGLKSATISGRTAWFCPHCQKHASKSYGCSTPPDTLAAASLTR
jgi:formamidopyrimidine-DNA glycosylase